ncbi:hypothetical protein BG011_008398 [Mortierella polycephala]|uniref:glucose-6-phosphate 1-epimerase n=1 Tax=Mortierella polycephala TaxID=41804 RepID=A0A9P6TX31_9FUNG|nr:hypothetical protein BG011_008398 [Mortierella polycephala]
MSVSQQSDKTILIHSSGASAEVYLLGATLTSWKTNNKEHIFLSEKSLLDGSKPIRGGNSRFAPLTSSVIENKVIAKFGLDPTMISDEHRKLWPFNFTLVYTVTLTADTLETKLHVQNTGDKAFDFNTLMHTYFLVPNVATVKVHGLDQLGYMDKVTQQNAKQEGDITVGGEVDKVFADVANDDIQVHFGAGQGGVQVHLDGVRDIVVWNPWVDKSVGMSDFGDDEYHRMICVEAGQVARFISLASGGSWEGRQVLSLL